MKKCGFCGRDESQAALVPSKTKKLLWWCQHEESCNKSWAKRGWRS